MTTVPQFMLAAVLVAGGVVVAGYVAKTIKPLSASTAQSSAPPAEQKVSCQLGQLLIYPNCYNVQTGNVDFNLNTGNRFSTPNSEIARITVMTGRICINDIYSPSVSFYGAGETTDIARNHIVTAIEDNTKILKRAW